MSIHDNETCFLTKNHFYIIEDKHHGTKTFGLALFYFVLRLANDAKHSPQTVVCMD